MYKQEEGKWKWSSGEQLTYTNWGVGIPNNPAPKYPNHDYTFLGYVLSGTPPLPESGYWDDMANTGQDVGWNVTSNAYRGIAEIPLSYFSIENASFREGKGGDVTIPAWDFHLVRLIASHGYCGSSQY